MLFKIFKQEKQQFIMELTNYEKETQSRYTGLSYNERFEVSREKQLSNLDFIIVQPELL